MTVKRYIIDTNAQTTPVPLDELPETERSRILERVFNAAVLRLGYTETRVKPRLKE